MTLAELLVNCVKFIAQDDEEINELSIDNFRTNPSYSTYFNNALNEINRSIQLIANQHKIPIQEFVFINDDSSKLFKVEYNDDFKKENIVSIFKVVYENDRGREKTVPYTHKPDGIVINSKDKGIYGVKVYPRPRLLTEADFNGMLNNNVVKDTSLDLNTIGVNDYMCTNVIPYLVKGELWLELEPNLAQASKTFGLQALASLEDGDNNEAYQDEIYIEIN